MIEGSMLQLTVHLPRGQTQQVNVEPSTPIMDLLVRLAVANHLSPGDHVIKQVANDKCRRFVRPLLPSARVDSLSTSTIAVVVKPRRSCSLEVVRLQRNKQQMPESRVRLRVFMPGKQLHVIRVSTALPLREVLNQVCHEKSLNPSDFQLNHPVDANEQLSLDRNVDDYNIRDVTLTGRKNTPSTRNRPSNEVTGDDNCLSERLRSFKMHHSEHNMHQETEVGGSCSSDSMCTVSLHSDDSADISGRTLPRHSQRHLAANAQNTHGYTSATRGQNEKRVAPAVPRQAGQHIERPRRRKRQAPAPPSSQTNPPRAQLLCITHCDGGQ